MNKQDLGMPFGFGRTAEVYDWGDGEVLKLFRSEYSRDSVEKEHAASEIVNRSKVPSPKVGEIVEVEGRYGIVFEKIVGTSMLRAVSKAPWLIVHYSKMLARLHALLHGVDSPKELPGLHEKLARNIRAAKDFLSETNIKKALDILGGLPDGTSLCHGDFHPDNIILTSNGPVLIDCNDVGRGNSLSDAARTSLLIGMGEVPGGKFSSRLLSYGQKLSCGAYIKAYRKWRPYDPRELDRWQVVNAASRLCERIPEKKRLVAYVETRLAKK